MTATNNQPAQAATPAPKTGLKAFNDFIRLPKTQGYLDDVLSEKKSQFVNNLVALVTNSENLQQCEPMTVMNAAIKATALNLPLDPNLGLAYIVPFWDRKANKRNAQFQIGYRGLLQLAIRSGQITKINVTEVRESELVSEDILTGDIVIKRTEGREGKKIIGYAAYMRLANGFEKTWYADREEIERFALRFTQQKTKDGRLANIWASDFDAMAKKTVLKALLKYAPLSTEMEQAIAKDEDYAKMTVTNYADAHTPEVIDAEAITIDDDQQEMPTTAPNAGQPEATATATTTGKQQPTF